MNFENGLGNPQGDLAYAYFTHRCDVKSIIEHQLTCTHLTAVAKNLFIPPDMLFIEEQETGVRHALAKLRRELMNFERRSPWILLDTYDRMRLDPVKLYLLLEEMHAYGMTMLFAHEPEQVRQITQTESQMTKYQTD